MLHTWLWPWIYWIKLLHWNTYVCVFTPENQLKKRDNTYSYVKWLLAKGHGPCDTTHWIPSRWHVYQWHVWDEMLMLFACCVAFHGSSARCHRTIDIFIGGHRCSFSIVLSSKHPATSDGMHVIQPYNPSSIINNHMPMKPMQAASKFSFQHRTRNNHSNASKQMNHIIATRNKQYWSSDFNTVFIWPRKSMLSQAEFCWARRLYLYPTVRTRNN